MWDPLCLWIRNLQNVKIAIVPNLIYKSKKFQWKSNSIFLEIEKLIPKFMWEFDGLEEGFILLRIKTCSKASLIYVCGFGINVHTSRAVKNKSLTTESALFLKSRLCGAWR